MPWEQKKNKILYRFPRYKGWSPAQEVIRSAEDALYDTKNVRVEDGVIKRRGGWSQLSTGDTDVHSIFSWEGNLVSIKQADSSSGILRKYDYTNSNWDTTNVLYDRFRNDAAADFTVAPRSDGQDFLVVADGVNENIKWGLNKVATELTGTIIFDGESDESWATGTVDTTNVRRGKNSIQLSATSGGTDSDTITFTGVPFSKLPSNINSNNAYVAGDNSNTEYDFAIKVPLTENITFTDIQLFLIPTGSPTGNLTLQCETDSSGSPSGTLIEASASDTRAGPSSGGWFTFTLDSGSVTYNKTFWITVSADSAQAANVSWYCVYNLESGGGLNVAYLSSDGGSTWSLPGTGDTWDPLYKLLDSSQNLDLDTNYVEYDEIVLWVYLDGTNSDIDLTNSNLLFTDGDAETATFVLTNQTITAGEWNQLIIARRDSTVGDWTHSAGVLDWSNITTLRILVTDTAAGVETTVALDSCYIRKTRTNATTGSKTRPFKAKYCDMSPHGDRLVLANTDSTQDYTPATLPNSGEQFIWYSDAYDIDTFTATNFISMPDKIKGLKTFGGLVHVFGDTQRWVMEPNYTASDYTSAALKWRIAKAKGPGTVSNRSIVEGAYRDQIGLFYLAKDGVYFTNGLDSTKVSKNCDVLFTQKFSSSARWRNESLSEANWSLATGAYYDSKYFLSYYPRNGADNQNMLILDSKTGEWMRDEMSGAVYPITMTVGEDSSSIPQLYAGADNGEVYTYVPSRTTQTDDGSTFTSHFTTPYIGFGVISDITWETLFLYIKSDETDALDIRIDCFDVNEETTGFDDWTESTTTAEITTSTTYTPTAFKWHRIKIPLEDMTTANKYLRSRAVSFKIYENNNEPVDIIPEFVVGRLGNSELDG